MSLVPTISIAGGVLPEDMLVEVIMRVPVNMMWGLRAVCKSWDALLTHPQFASKLLDRQKKVILSTCFSRFYARKYVALFRLNHQPRILFEIDHWAGRKLDFDENLNFPDCFKECVVVGSINGIVCLSSFHESDTRFVALWNPAINYWKPIRLLPYQDGDDVYDSIALAFDSLTNDYKIIRLASVFFHYKPTFRIEVYSANQDSWSVVNPQIHFFTTHSNCSLILKGVPYWSKNYVPGERGRYDAYQTNFIASVDPHTGLYNKIEYPQIVLNQETSVHPFNLMDSLGLLIYSPGDKPDQSFHVYALLDDDNSSATTWTNIYSTAAPTILQNKDICILQCFEDAGKILVSGWNHDHDASFLYDSIGLDAFRPRWDESYYHVESLVRIPGMKPIQNEDDSHIERTEPMLIGRLLGPML